MKTSTFVKSLSVLFTSPEIRVVSPLSSQAPSEGKVTFTILVGALPQIRSSKISMAHAPSMIPDP